MDIERPAGGSFTDRRQCWISNVLRMSVVPETWTSGAFSWRLGRPVDTEAHMSEYLQPRYLTKLALLLVVYFVTARLGLWFQPVSGVAIAAATIYEVSTKVISS